MSSGVLVTLVSSPLAPLTATSLCTPCLVGLEEKRTARRWVEEGGGGREVGTIEDR